MLETVIPSLATVVVASSISFLIVRFYYNRPPIWVQDLFEPIDEQGTTKIDTWIARAVDSLFARFQFSAMGQKSGQARVEKGLQKAMLNDVIDSTNPILGMAMEQFPQVKEYLMKHPNAIPQVLNMIAPILQGKGLNMSRQRSEYRSKY